uniref:Uncharacterized protein n=1 Tax=Hanusia phi TaxID=3032 RepID=A0A7S0EQ24_9CRYP|mmetsp:Transcript_29379/g.66548  ORF Transcript_29379/g.66548 Transcript_29379/m.66548 type:complete len:322 (+) Transcript_29379:3-968(+)
MMQEIFSCGPQTLMMDLIGLLSSDSHLENTYRFPETGCKLISIEILSREFLSDESNRKGLNTIKEDAEHKPQEPCDDKHLSSPSSSGHKNLLDSSIFNQDGQVKGVSQSYGRDIEVNSNQGFKHYGSNDDDAESSSIPSSESMQPSFERSSRSSSVHSSASSKMPSNAKHWSRVGGGDVLRHGESVQTRGNLQASTSHQSMRSSSRTSFVSQQSEETDQEGFRLYRDASDASTSEHRPSSSSDRSNRSQASSKRSFTSKGSVSSRPHSCEPDSEQSQSVTSSRARAKLRLDMVFKSREKTSERYLLREYEEPNSFESKMRP